VYKPKDAEGYVMLADITIRGVTKEIEVPLEILGKVVDPAGNTRIGIQPHTEINRRDFGVSWNKTVETGGLVIANEVKIDLDIETIKVKE
jgi:polyisoprenoid-binding protein YceI